MVHTACAPPSLASNQLQTLQIFLFSDSVRCPAARSFFVGGLLRAVTLPVAAASSHSFPVLAAASRQQPVSRSRALSRFFSVTTRSHVVRMSHAFSLRATRVPYPDGSRRPSPHFRLAPPLLGTRPFFAPRGAPAEAQVASAPPHAAVHCTHWSCWRFKSQSGYVSVSPRTLHLGSPRAERRARQRARLPWRILMYCQPVRRTLTRVTHHTQSGPQNAATFVRANADHHAIASGHWPLRVVRNREATPLATAPLLPYCPRAAPTGAFSDCHDAAASSACATVK